MPQPIAHFLAQSLKRRVDVELHATLEHVESDWFQRDGEDVQQAYKALLMVIGRHAQIPATAWEGMLAEACTQVVHHLVQPVPTLCQFVGDDAGEAIPEGTLRRRLGYFLAYPYLGHAVETYLGHKELAALSPTQLQEVLRRVDQAMTGEYGSLDWVRLLEPLFVLAGQVPAVTAQPGIPVPLLATFFEDKRRPDLAALVTQAQQTQGLDALLPDALQTVLDGTFAAAPPSATPVVASPSRRPPTPSGQAPASDASVPLWMRFREDGGSDAARSAVQEAPASDASVPLWMRFKEETPHAPEPMAGPPERPGLQHLEAAVLGPAAAQRSWFIEHLFGGSVEAYETVLKDLRSLPTWQEASRLIARDVFRRNKVNIYAEPAVAFTNAVEIRYRQRAS